MRYSPMAGTYFRVHATNRRTAGAAVRTLHFPGRVCYTVCINFRGLYALAARFLEAAACPFW